MRVFLFNKSMWVMTATAPYLHKLLALIVVLTVIWISIATRYSMNVIHVYNVRNSAAFDIRSDMTVHNSSDLFDILLPSAQNYSEETNDDLVAYDVTETIVINKYRDSLKRNNDHHISTKSLSSKVKINDDFVVNEDTGSKLKNKNSDILKRIDDHHIIKENAKSLSSKVKINDDLVVNEDTESKLKTKNSDILKKIDDHHVIKQNTKSLSSKVKINDDLVVNEDTESKLKNKNSDLLKRIDDHHIINQNTKSLSSKVNIGTKKTQSIRLPPEDKKQTEVLKKTEMNSPKPLNSELLEYIKNNYNVKEELETIKKAIEYFQERDKVVNPLDFKFLHNGHKICNGKKQPWLLIMILSVASNTKERSIIRKTWGSVARGKKWRGTNKEFDSVKIMFIFGKSKNEHDDKILTREIDTYGDIVQADFVDSYNNLTRKVLMGVKWTTIFCPDVKYLMKVDDDTFVHVPNAARVLRRIRIPANGAVFGNTVRGVVLREGKWGLSYELFPFSNYPPYASGQTYTLSGNILHKIIWTGERLPYIFIEDAFVTGVVRTIIGAELIPLIGFPKVFMATAQPCAFHNTIRVAATNINVTLMRNIWQSFSDKTIVDCYNCLSEKC